MFKKTILYNKFVLYAITIFAYVNLILSILTGNYAYPLIFVLTFIIIYHFVSKNMIIVYLATTILAGLFSGASSNSTRQLPGFDSSVSLFSNASRIEGLENMEDDESNEVANAEIPLDRVDRTDNTENKDLVFDQYEGTVELDDMETMTNNMANLQNMLDPDSIKNITDDTKKLINQQNELFKTMENLGPIVQNAQNLLKNFGIDDIGSLMNNLANKGAGGSKAGKKKVIGAKIVK